MKMKLMLSVVLTALWAVSALAQSPLRIEITEGVIEPMPFAAPFFVPETGGSEQFAADITQVVINDLVGSGLFREIPREAHISGVSDFMAPVAFADWKAINAQALITGAAALGADGNIQVKFQLWDVFAQQTLGEGVQFAGSAQNWRRMAHKVADTIYARLTGEEGYFDSRVVFVSESGPKDARRKQLALMDYDGANMRFLTDDSTLVLSPRFSPTAQQVLYTSYESGQPKVYLMDVDSLQKRSVENIGGMTFGPRFSPDGGRIVLSAEQGANTDIYAVDLGSGAASQLTNNPSIETSPSYSPDGTQVVFESDRGGSQQLYVMPASGGEGTRISFGDGKYGTPVWSPRGDLIAFTKIAGGRFHIGVMRTDGSEERLLTASFLDEAPTWAPNGRVLMFFRESSGESGAPQLFSVDITGRNLRQVPTPGFASDPSWSRLLP